MAITETIMKNGNILRESDSGYYIENENGVRYASARDKDDTEHTYTETTELIETTEE